jgi:cobalt-zinc-cadmium efflux system membrane fusion protein
MILNRALTLVACALALGACSKAASDKSLPPARVEKDSVVFEPSSPQIGSIQSADVVPQREVVVKLNGRLVWNEDRTVRVFSPYSGRVVSIVARPGDRVKPGQALAVLASPDLGSAQSEARKAEQDALLASKSLARVQELYDAGVAPAKDLQAAQADAARTAAERTRTQEKLKLYSRATHSGDLTVDQQLELRTPIAGVVVERNLNPGQELRTDNQQADKPQFVVSDPTRLWFVLDVAEKDLADVRPGVAVRIGAASLGDDRVEGRIVHVADVVDPQTRTVKARGTIERADPRLKAEMFVTAELTVPSAKGLLVPSRAIYLRGEQYFAFIDAGNGRYVRRAVKVGAAGDGNQLVLAGLGVGDKVVVDGTLLLEKILASKD